MERGHWVLLDNVNFCNPSVLDRINPLLEPSGVLIINECGSIGGKVRIIKPHKNFRLFMCMDPNYGEVSRAMRNRCVEIVLPDKSREKLPLITESEIKDISMNDLKTKIGPLNSDLISLTSAKVPNTIMTELFVCIHQIIERVLYSYNYVCRITFRNLKRWIRLTCHQINQGTDLRTSLGFSINQAYSVQFFASKNFLDNVLDKYFYFLEHTDVIPTFWRTMTLCRPAYIHRNKILFPQFDAHVVHSVFILDKFLQLECPKASLCSCSEDIKNKLSAIILVILGQSSYNGWEFVVRYFEKILSKYSENTFDIKNANHSINIRNVIRSIFESFYISDLFKKFHDLCSSIADIIGIPDSIINTQAIDIQVNYPFFDIINSLLRIQPNGITKYESLQSMSSKILYYARRCVRMNFELTQMHFTCVNKINISMSSEFLNICSPLFSNMDNILDV